MRRTSGSGTNAPDAIADCEKKIDQFDDLDQEGVSKFKREAVNCLASVGFFDNYPGISTASSDDVVVSADTGLWKHFEGETVDGQFEGYWLAASTSSAGSAEFVPHLALRCGIGNDAWDAVFISTPWTLRNDYTTERFTVVWRFSDASRPTTDNGWWSDGKADSAVFGTVEFLRALQDTNGNRLYVELTGSYSTETAQFPLDGIDGVFDNLHCL